MRHFGAWGVDLAYFSGYPPRASAPRRIARSRREELSPGKRCCEIFVSRTRGVAAPRARGAESTPNCIGRFEAFRCLRYGFGVLFRVPAAHLRAATDREISTRRAQTWQKMLRDLRFARTRGRAAVRATRETTPTCIGRFKAFRCLRCAAPSALLGSTAQIVRSRRK